MKIREEVKIMLVSKCVTLTELARRMTEMTDKSYSQSLLSHKLAKETLKYSEMKLICKILGYKLHVELDEIKFTH